MIDGGGPDAEARGVDGRAVRVLAEASTGRGPSRRPASAARLGVDLAGASPEDRAEQAARRATGVAGGAPRRGRPSAAGSAGREQLSAPRRRAGASRSASVAACQRARSEPAGIDRPGLGLRPCPARCRSARRRGGPGGRRGGCRPARRPRRRRRGPRSARVAGLGEPQVDRGQVAGVVAVARADRERDEVAGLDGEPFDRADLRPPCSPARCPRRAGAGSPRGGVRATRSRRCRIRGGRASRAASTRTSPSTGLRQPTAARRVGEGWTATPCGFMLPGMRTCWSDEFASSCGSLVAAPAVDEVVAPAAGELAR